MWRTSMASRHGSCAMQAIESGAAKAKLDALVALSSRLAQLTCQDTP